ncbi:dTDP-4-dehydrorhamnose 3,5-epimerase [Oceanibacterium hippocampi]|uniref:dTDP-4-dehydrorhamnose 3,5-epimerase n=1 Tax=Oceanibacterium hippocampi TaxID=745714 RepID=A0A1Y5TGF5_9PROT|nr:dTDP-4-dehydrorhamnose 3,5-epimerase [Oceanibacterium hippocampi]SLN63153.1 dTDP-4-dehydrorhamnose 3,5-epimerase [Oceanibacterium hippocampi]
MGAFSFTELAIPGARLVDCRVHRDQRGIFTRMLCADEFTAAGITRPFVQSNLSSNNTLGTVRGLHFLATPKREGKFVRCVVGAVFDVFVDIRKGSPTFGQWYGVELSAENARAIYVPPGCAHGYQTLTEQSVVSYFVQDSYDQSLDRTLSWADPAVGIDWPIADRAVLSEKDSAAPDLAGLEERDLLAFERSC